MEQCLLHYEPLNHHKDEIRLLEPVWDRVDTDRSGLDWTLQIVSLSQDRPEYVALSYPWGSSRDREAVKVNGEDVWVSRNLRQALYRVSKYWQKAHGNQRKGLFLWCDQICIDQASVDEKNHQVAFMGQIYRSANLVLVYLSEESRDLDGDWTEWKDWPACKQDVTKHLPCEQRPRIIQASQYLRSVNFLLRIARSPWWSRTWIYQEFVVASEVTFLSRQFAIPWRELQDLLSLFFRSLKTQLSQFARLQALSSLRKDAWFDIREQLGQVGDAKIAIDAIRDCDQLFKINTVTLTQVLPFARKSRCADIRDHVFAFLGLLDHDPSLTPSYDTGTTAAQVYTAATISIIQRERNLHFFFDAADWQEYKQMNNSPNDLSMPSWVPNWGLDYTSVFTAITNEDGNGYSSQLFGTEASRDMQPITRLNLDAALKSCALTVRGVFLENLKSDADTAYVGFRQSVFNGSGLSRFFEIRTAWNAEPGDEVWIIFGLTVPFVFRPRQGGSKRYSLIAPATLWEYGSYDEPERQTPIMYSSWIDLLEQGRVEAQDITIV